MQDENLAAGRAKSAPSRLKAAFLAIPKGVMPFVALGGGVLVAAVLFATAPKVVPQGTGETAFPIAAQEVRAGTIQPQITAFGSVIAGRQIDLRSNVAGEIVWRAENLKDGGRVKTGDVLVRIDPFDYETQVADRKAQLAEARAGLTETKARIRATGVQLDKARTQLTLRQREYDRARALKKDGTVSQKYLDQAQIALTQQQQAVAQAESELEIADARVTQQQATISRLSRAVATAERNLDDSELKAPFDGVAARVYADLGKRVAPNEPITTLIDDTSLEVRFTLPSVQYGRLLEAGTLTYGAPVQVQWRIGGATVQAEAMFDRVGAEIDTRTGGVDVYAKLENGPDHQTISAIRAGAFVEVLLDDRSFENAIRLPEDAVYDSNHIYEVMADNRLHPVPVQVLAYTGNDVILSSPELRDGAKVLITRLPRAGQGVLVDVRDLKALPPQPASAPTPAAEAVGQ